MGYVEARVVNGSAFWWRLVLRTLGLLAVGALAAAPAAGSRVALVIGNAAYEAPGAALANPVNDARAVAAVLRDELGFDVIEATDVSVEATARVVDRFIGRIKAGDEAVFFYSGHGMELQDGNRLSNYLIPVDMSPEWDVVRTRTRSLSASELQERMEGAGAGVRILILDACRDNPFDGKSLGRGLGPMQPRGGLVVFAAEAGGTASDNPGMSNGLFTTHLLEGLREPGLTATALFGRVGRAVATVSGGRQQPAYYAAGAGDFVFRQSSSPPPPPPPPPPTAENLFWESIRESTAAVDFEDYLRQFPDGTFARLARRRMEALADVVDVVPPPDVAQRPVTPPPPDDAPTGLKYRILRRGPAGDAVPVDPTTAFRSGDRIRFAFEPHIDGFLYVLLQGSSGKWSSLLPHPQIAGGRNTVLRFGEVAVPPQGWFRLDDTPGTERVFVCLTQEPAETLPGVGGSVVQVQTVDQQTVNDLISTIGSMDMKFETEESADTQAVYVVNPTGSTVWSLIELRHE